MIAIQCLTGTHPTFLEADPRSGDLLWENQVTARPELIAILDCMTRYQSSNRYTSAREVLQDLAKLHARDSQASRSEDSPIEALKKNRSHLTLHRPKSLNPNP